jgi:DMSO/TMAO reductase YedYZ molybdopterin-dependent catalytic subunit
MLVPNIYGMKNVKWIRTIEVVNYDFLGYWQQQGWSDSAVVNTNSRIDLPGRNVRWTGGEVVIGGIAFAGSRGIAKVELSADAGKTWSATQLETPPGALAWRRWTYRWTPPGPGAFKLAVRSTDGAGNTETPVRRDPYPDGSTGYDTIDLNVQRA